LLVPDQVQPGVFNGHIAPKLKKDAAIVIASGYNVFYKFLNISPTNDVVMVAPRWRRSLHIDTHILTFFSRMIGSSVRSLYQKGQGFPCFVSAEQDGTGKALEIALALSRAIGATKAGAIASSAREETAMDLFAEQGLWPNIIMLFREAFSVLKEAGCSDEALCYEMWAPFSKRRANLGEIDTDDNAGGCRRSLLRFSNVLPRTDSSANSSTIPASPNTASSRVL
jgi:ketol-acid reductoisomerase